jgi:hypothetical protein
VYFEDGSDFEARAEKGIKNYGEQRMEELFGK